MVSLIVHAVLGVATTGFVVWCNRRLFTGRWDGIRVSPLEGVFWIVGVVSVALGWYFNIRYVQELGSTASWVHFTESLFENWPARSAAQDYIIANVVLFPLWTIVDGRRRGIAVPWGFFVMSLFTSFAFAMAAYLAVVERQVRYDRARSAGRSRSSAMAMPDSPATA
jgi:hypothetical protein